jgi:hypothetical protein
MARATPQPTTKPTTIATTTTTGMQATSIDDILTPSMRPTFTTAPSMAFAAQASLISSAAAMNTFDNTTFVDIMAIGANLQRMRCFYSCVFLKRIHPSSSSSSFSSRKAISRSSRGAASWPLLSIRATRASSNRRFYSQTRRFAPLAC